MGFFDIFKKRKSTGKKEEFVQAEPEQNTESDEKISFVAERTLNKATMTFFPESGKWSGVCFNRSNDLSKTYLPCHTRDSEWLAKMLKKEPGVPPIISLSTAKRYVETSELFAKKRHDYELEIVKWQIKWINNDGENWLIPDGFDDFDFYMSPNVDKMVRGGVVKTLNAIGMNGEVIEEGLEKFAELWRPAYFNASFNNSFEPVYYMQGVPEPASDEHQEAFLACREYEYYQEHKDSVDKYGTKTVAMHMTKEEYAKLLNLLEIKNAERNEYLRNWKASQTNKKPKFTDNHYIQPEKLTQPSGNGEGKIL